MNEKMNVNNGAPYLNLCSLLHEAWDPNINSNDEQRYDASKHCFKEY